jgi:3-hydroxyisobutyrate dehydrogenase-like beta-hydroxyacid dehydrogenase
MAPGDGSRPALAFLGLGALGAPMAANLARAGFPLTLCNRTAERCRALIADLQPSLLSTLGVAAEPAEAAAAAPIICLCLSDDAAVEAVLAAAAPGLRPGSLVIDFSTIAPATSCQAAARLADHGVAYIDAPVTGGTEGAAAGTLSVLVGAMAQDLKRARPVLEVVGQRISHFGPVGAGQQAKAVNQVLVAGSYAAVAEALALGQRLGLPMERVVEALSGGAAGSWAVENRSAGMLRGEFPLGFRLRLHRKDLAIALDSAAACGLQLPVGALVAQLEDSLIERGHGDEDVSALARLFQPPGV